MLHALCVCGVVYKCIRLDIQRKKAQTQQIRRIILTKNVDVLHKPCLKYGLKSLAYFSTSVQ